MPRFFNRLSQKLRRKVIEKNTMLMSVFHMYMHTHTGEHTYTPCIHIHKTMEYIQWLLLISCKTAKYIISSQIYSCFYYLLQLRKGLKRHMCPIPPQWCCFDY